MPINSESLQQSGDTRNLTALLAQNNEYLKQLLALQQKEYHQAKRQQLIHIISVLIPFLALAIIGYFVWQSITHYLDILNNNVNTLKSNFDSLRTFFEKFIPDFSSIGSKLKDTWESIQF